MNYDHDDSDNDYLADVFEQYRNDETTDHYSEVFGRAGTGKTTHLAAWWAAVSDHHTNDTEPEWFDPKGAREGEANHE